MFRAFGRHVPVTDIPCGISTAKHGVIVPFCVYCHQCILLSIKNGFMVCIEPWHAAPDICQKLYDFLFTVSRKSITSLSITKTFPDIIWLKAIHRFLYGLKGHRIFFMEV